MVWISVSLICFLFVSFSPLEARHHPANGFSNEEAVYIYEPHQDDSNLSPWELHVVHDLLVEIMLMKCQNVNTTAARGMKSFITSKVSKATKRSVMHPEFMSVYSNMVKCMDYIEKETKEDFAFGVNANADSPPNEVKAETKWSKFLAKAVPQTDRKWSRVEIEPEEETEYHQSPKVHLLEDAIEDQGKDVIMDIFPINGIKDGKKNPKKSEKAKELSVQKSAAVETYSHNQGEDSSNGKTVVASPLEENDASILIEAEDILRTILNSATVIVSSIGERSKRTVANEKFHYKVHNKDSKNTQANQNDYSRKQSMNNVRSVLETMNQIVSSSCPPKYKLNDKFIAKAIREIMHWVNMDWETTLGAYYRYFGNGYTAMQIEQCFSNENFMKSDVSIEITTI